MFFSGMNLADVIFMTTLGGCLYFELKIDEGLTLIGPKLDRLLLKSRLSNDDIVE